MRTLHDGLVCVTGAGSGIGRATALHFAAEGARVLCVDIDGSAAEKTAAGCAEAGARDAAAYAVDVSDAGAMRTLADRVHADHGTLDVLVNNAGVGMSGRLQDMSLEHWTWIRSINLDGVVHGCHVFGPAMLERGRGHVVNVASGLAYTPRATEPAYVATKAAVLALSQCLRADWRDSGVGVTAVCPGVIDTPIVERSLFVGLGPQDQERARRLFRRGHAPDKVARAIVRATRTNRAVVPVGIEAWAGRLLHRFAPVSVQQRVARRRLPEVRGAPSSPSAPSAPLEPRTRHALEGSTPFTVVTDDGATLHGEVAGEGPVVVLAHCWTGTRAVWGEVGQRLAGSGHRVVLYDHRGHGASTCGSEPVTLERIGADLRAVLEHLDVRGATLAGHSLGGMAIQRLAIDAPAALSERVGRVVLVATSARGVRMQRLSPIARRVIAGSVAQRVMSSPAADRIARSAFGRSPHAAHVAATRESFAACDASLRAELLGAMHAMDLRALRRLDIDVTVVAGRRDRLTPVVRSREIALRLGADLHVLEDAGHMLPLERPEALAELVATRRSSRP